MKTERKVGIIGSGWYGCHEAIKLTQSGFKVTLFEKGSKIFDKVSGKFGVRLHAGPHYPRSQETRSGCRRNFVKFHREYPSLIVYHDFSIYSIGDIDADGKTSKVSREKFKAVCNENVVLEQTDNPEQWGYNHLLYAAKIYEPSIKIGTQLRNEWQRLLQAHKVNIVYNCEVTKIMQHESNKVSLFCRQKYLGMFNYVINTTGYQATTFIAKEIQLPFEVKYQACIAFVYKDNYPKCNPKPFSFIVLDGFFPCIMPYVGENKNSHEYILTHGRWTILGSFDTPQQGYKILNKLNSDLNSLNQIKENAESAINHFWPQFKQRFTYVRWEGAVLAKLKTEVEFRGAVTFATKNVIHVTPGKISNIFDVEDEILKIINAKNDDLINGNGYSYVKGGVLDNGITEITTLPKPDDERNTCTLQTYRDLNKEKSSSMSENSTQNKSAFFKSGDNFRKPGITQKTKSLLSRLEFKSNL